MKKIKVVVVDQQGRAEVQEIDNCLEGYYQTIGCQLIDITERKIGDIYYDIVVDDEGLLCSGPICTAINKENRASLFGTLIVCHHDEEGNLTSLEDGEDIENVLDSLRVVIDDDNNLRVVLQLNELY